MTRVEQIAKAFHEAYERHSPGFFGKSGHLSVMPWEQVPAVYRRVMLATCEDVVCWMGMDGWAKFIHERMVSKGFWSHITLGAPEDGPTMINPSIWAEKLALIHSEVSEVLEARRDGDEALEEEECADIIIRVLDYAAARGFEMDKAVDAKMRANAERPHQHGRGLG